MDYGSNLRLEESMKESCGLIRSLIIYNSFFPSLRYSSRQATRSKPLE